MRVGKKGDVVSNQVLSSTAGGKTVAILFFSLLLSCPRKINGKVHALLLSLVFVSRTRRSQGRIKLVQGLEHMLKRGPTMDHQAQQDVFTPAPSK